MNRLNLEGVYNPYAELMKGFNSIDADTLMDKPLPNSCFLVEGLVPEGVNMLSGASKKKPRKEDKNTPSSLRLDGDPEKRSR